MLRWTDAARDHVRAMLQGALDAASPQALMRQARVVDGDLVLPGGERVRFAGRKARLVAVGKAAGGMATHVQRWGRFEEALVVAPNDAEIPGYECRASDHPVPSARSVAAGERMLELARATGPDDLLVLLLSGGASALAEVPAVPLPDLVRTTELLLRGGASIGETNAVRRHLSRLKGGRLAQACRGELVVLAISDVPGDDLAALGSGPAAPDATTFADAIDVLRERGLLEAVPSSVRAHLEAGVGGEVAETAKPGDPAFERVRARVLADNDTAVRGAATVAHKLGYETRVLLGFLRGEARDRGRELAAIAREAARSNGRPLAVVAGGETTVRVEGHGKGGRNQEVALAAVEGIAGLDAVLACIGTDGVDGPTDAAGAIVDGHTLGHARHLSLDADAHLAENDAYAYFEALHDLVRTGPTGTNVRDVCVLLVRASSLRPEESRLRALAEGRSPPDPPRDTTRRHEGTTDDEGP